MASRAVGAPVVHTLADRAKATPGRTEGPGVPAGVLDRYQRLAAPVDGS